MCVLTRMPLPTGQKRTSEPLQLGYTQLELPKVGAENSTRVLCKTLNL